MKRIINLTFVISLVLSISGCVTTQVANLRPQGKEDIEVFVNKTPTREYDETMYIEASGSIFHNKKQLLRKLKSKAQKEGADAIVNVRFDYTGWWPYIAGVAIKYK